MAEAMNPAPGPPLIRFGRSGAELNDFEWSKVVEYVAEGRSERTAAGLVGVVFEALAEQEAKDPAFRSAMQDARSRRIGAVEDAFYDSARGGEPKAQVEWLRNHDPVRYRKSPEPPPAARDQEGDDLIRAGALLALSGREKKLLQTLLQSALGVGPSAPAPRDVNPRPKKARARRRTAEALEIGAAGLPPPGERAEEAEPWPVPAEDDDA